MVTECQNKLFYCFYKGVWYAYSSRKVKFSLRATPMGVVKNGVPNAILQP